MFAQRTFSTSQQFILYCPDANLRSRIASFAEEVKSEFLKLIGESDHWKERQHPIVITVQEAVAAGDQAAAAVSIFQGEGGFKVQIDVRMGADPAQVDLQRHVLRALMLEYAYRDQADLLRPGVPYTEPPWWLLEGARQMLLRRDSGLDTDLFKRIVDVNRLPPMSKFLQGAPHDFDGTAVELMDQACAMCLVQLLAEQPDGHRSLGKLLQHWPTSNDNPVGGLLREFAGLGSSEQTLQKWWTLNLARFSAADRYKGLTAAETEANLAKILQLEIPSDEGSTKARFPITDFPKYMKLKASKDVLVATQAALQALGLRSSALHAPVVAEYADIAGQLAHGKTRGIKDRLTKIDQLRSDLDQRMGAIGDYLNWFEATQMDVRSGKFAGYLRIANEMSKPLKRNDPLTQFMDDAELVTATPTSGAAPVGSPR